MVSVDASNITLEDAIQATEFMSMRDLPEHVYVGPMPPGSVLLTDLPLKDLDPASNNLKHVLDVVLGIPAAAVDLSTIKAIFREKAWKELP